ncbi:PREDICTED: uncharacterized protein LOC109227845 [Nicotiana attenuata]|uniref:Myb-like domain-containing protein n=1 Tax=Nicotiana attenuata TaxID=49451 RepID=A0A1J6J6F5_NICAT|nr:PREDICTED: uncharacterized protein LOC109227845 [Nicotiana attenuata]OIT08240.1 hypothetical protein A4A49_27647 [Nicotiana attenuata]
MPQRNLRDQENPTPTLRRSPRFTAAATEISANEAHKNQIEVSKSFQKSSTGLRRSSRLSIVNLQNNGAVNSIERRVTRSSTWDPSVSKVLGYASTDNSVEKRKGDLKNGPKIPTHAQETSKESFAGPSSEVAGCGKDDNGTGKKGTGLKRKRTNQGMEESSSANGWTNKQELALQNAYFAAKATPNFWKKVAKMVPGKSAKECFDKIHSDFMTPPQPQPRSRVKKMNTSSLSPCATKLLLSTGKTTKKLRYSKPKNHLSRKKVRQLLQKQNDVDRDKEVDFFNVLESTDPTDRAFCQNTEIFTPERNEEGLHYLRKCLERSSSAHKKHLSRLSGLSVATLTSPPVLKPIKNKVLHERYIDQLHCREAKRKAAATSRSAMGRQNKNDHKDENVRKMDVIKVAKNALISEARDAINQFQNIQIHAMDIFNDDDDEIHNSDDDAEDV